MKRGIVVVIAAALMLVSVSSASADQGPEEFSLDTRATSVVQGEEWVTPNEKWVFFQGKEVTTEGFGSIGASELAVQVDATLKGRLSPDGTEGLEIGAFTIWLTSSFEDPVACDGSFLVRRYVDDRYPDGSPVPYGEAGTFHASCDDGTLLIGDVVGEFGALNGIPGFVVSFQGIALR